MRNDFTTKEVTKLIGCHSRFIPSLTSKVKKHEKSIWNPIRQGRRGIASTFTYNEMLMLACLHKMRRLKLERKWCRELLVFIEKLYPTKIGYLITDKDQHITVEVHIDAIERYMQRRAKILGIEL